MTFFETVPDEGAPEPVAQLYDADRDAQGQVPNYTRAFSLHPELYGAWRGLLEAVKSDMDLRRYELVTLAAARRLRSSYCALAHGSVLADRFMPEEQLLDVVADHRHAGLDDVDVAVMDLAEKVAGDASTVTREDVDRLRALGLSDRDVLDVVATARHVASTARCWTRSASSRTRASSISTSRCCARSRSGARSLSRGPSALGAGAASRGPR
jgi:uncharacterized peroxidase-related enzyme